MEHTAFELTSGGIIGRDHRERCANYQDGAYITRGPAGTVGIITDGCGSGAHSEVGAQFGARLVGEATRRELERHGLTALDWQRLRHDVLSELHGRVSAMGGSFRQTVNDYFLFTVVGVILAGDLALFFALGDGVVIVNGEVTSLGPWPGNQPPYLGYGLLGGSVTSLPPDQLEFQVVRSLPLDRLNHFLLGSDGVSDLIAAADRQLPGLPESVGPVSQFWTGERYYAPDGFDSHGRSVHVDRRLKLAARDWPKSNPLPGRLPDDTTLIAGRRRSSVTR